MFNMVSKELLLVIMIGSLTAVGVAYAAVTYLYTDVGLTWTVVEEPAPPPPPVEVKNWVASDLSLGQVYPNHDTPAQAMTVTNNDGVSHILVFTKPTNIRIYSDASLQAEYQPITIDAYGSYTVYVVVTAGEGLGARAASIRCQNG